MVTKQIFLNLGVFEDNKYLDFYLQLINNNLNNLKQQYTQKHHIIPKCVSNYLNQPINKLTINILYKNHILAHYYLCLCSKGCIKYKLENALFHLLNRKKEFNIEELDQLQSLYQHYIDSLKNKNISTSTKEKMSIAQTIYYKSHPGKLKDKHHTELTKQLMSNKAKGRKRSLSSRKKESLKLKGIKFSEEHKYKIGQSKKGNINRLGFKDNLVVRQNKSLSHIGLNYQKCNIKCLNDGNIFKTYASAAKYYNISKSTLYSCFKGTQSGQVEQYYFIKEPTN